MRLVASVLDFEIAAHSRYLCWVVLGNTPAQSQRKDNTIYPVSYGVSSHHCVENGACRAFICIFF